MKFKYLASLLVFIVLTGCSSLTPQQRFPTFAQQATQFKTIDVVVDATVLSDIEGSNTGFNQEKNAAARAEITESVKALFKQKGFQANIVFVSSGLFLENTEESKNKLVFSHDWEETGEDFSGPITDAPDSIWMTKEGKALFNKIAERGIVENKSTDKRANKRSSPKVEFTDIPAPVYQLSSDLLAVVRHRAFEVSADKSIGTGIATGLLTGLLTGGMYIGVSVPVSSANLDITLFDLNNLEVVWNNNTQVQGNAVAGINPTVQALLKPLPSSVETIASDQVVSTNR